MPLLPPQPGRSVSESVVTDSVAPLTVEDALVIRRGQIGRLRKRILPITRLQRLSRKELQASLVTLPEESIQDEVERLSAILHHPIFDRAKGREARNKKYTQIALAAADGNLPANSQRYLSRFWVLGKSNAERAISHAHSVTDVKREDSDSAQKVRDSLRQEQLNTVVAVGTNIGIAAAGYEFAKHANDTYIFSREEAGRPLDELVKFLQPLPIGSIIKQFFVGKLPFLKPVISLMPNDVPNPFPEFFQRAMFDPSTYKILLGLAISAVTALLVSRNWRTRGVLHRLESHLTSQVTEKVSALEGQGIPAGEIVYASTLAMPEQTATIMQSPTLGETDMPELAPTQELEISVPIEETKKDSSAEAEDFIEASVKGPQMEVTRTLLYQSIQDNATPRWDELQARIPNNLNSQERQSVSDRLQEVTGVKIDGEGHLGFNPGSGMYQLLALQAIRDHIDVQLTNWHMNVLFFERFIRKHKEHKENLVKRRNTANELLNELHDRIQKEVFSTQIV